MVHFNQYTDHDEPGSEMSPEEMLARQAFGRLGYRRVEDYRVWTPTSLLMEDYERAWRSRPRPGAGEPDPELVDRRQLGAIVQMIYPHAVAVTRRYRTQNTRGWAFLGGGPGSIRSGGEKDPESA